MNGVLDGIRVLDLTQMVAGPLCTMLLGDLGADVIKVEPPEGETARHIGINRSCGESDYFLSVNRNKRSIVLDLKTETGIDTLKSLAEQADVIVENFRPGTMEKLGIGYETLRASNARLIYCGLTGFGTTGPYRDRPALDPIIQAMSGVMQLTGTANSGPLKTGMLLSDFVPPIFGVIGVLSALRARDQSGTGQRVDVSMLDATVFSMVPREQYFFSTGKTPQRQGNAHHQLAPWNTFETSDGRYLMIVAHNEKYWLKLLAALGRNELATDERFVTNAARMDNREVLSQIIADVIVQRPLADWSTRLTAGDVLFSLVRDFPDVFNDPVVRDTMMQTIAHPTVGDLPQVRSPIRMDATPVSMRRAPPLLGEHTRQILAEGWAEQNPIERQA